MAWMRSGVRLTVSMAMLALAGVGCGADTGAPPAELVGEGPLGKADDGSASGTGLVVRARLDVSEAEGHRVAIEDHPFSHRGRKSHQYIATFEPGSTQTIRVHVDDAKVEEVAVWVYGPIASDGSWGKPVAKGIATPDAEISFEPEHYGTYAIVVGPRTDDDFQPRYPSHYAAFRDADGERRLAQLDDQGERASLYLDDDVTYEIVSPLPSNQSDPAVGETFIVRGPGGEERELVLEEFSQVGFYLSEDAQSFADSVLGDLSDGELTLEPGSSDAQTFRVVRALDDEGKPSETPVILEVVPTAIEGRETRIFTQENCDHDLCSYAIYADDGSRVALADTRYFKSSYYDFHEPSTYDLELSCEGACGGPAGGGEEGRASEALAQETKYPVYFGHGFKSSSMVWRGVFDYLLSEIGVPMSLLSAMNVDKFNGVPERTEQLRRNLEEFLADKEPARGESYARVNIVAHSMAGLDSRYLTGNPKYNERCLELLCTSATGEAEACCEADANGQPIMWRNRVASITTLSTPHGGSSFADFGVRQMDGSWLGDAIEGVLELVFGLRDAPDGLIRYTIFNLTRTFSQETMAAEYPLLNRFRRYTFGCATGEDDGECNEGRPRRDAAPVERDGKWTLPPPNEQATIFSWAGQSCFSGKCGDVIDPGLIPAYMIVRDEEGENDGVVSIESAKFGIFMGVRATDHFHWNRLPPESRGIRTRIGDWLFGLKSEPASKFHEYWLSELARAGY